jgi:hypothetical protein
MRDALKDIARFGNESRDPDEPAQAAAIAARKTLEDLNLYFEGDGTSEDKPQASQ